MLSLMASLIWKEFQMKIEIAEPGKMTQSGSSLLRLIQNNSTPLIDLLIRESIQNSLDAAKDSVDYVNMEFKTGSFFKKSLNEEFDEITDALNRRFPAEKYDYIAIRDSNTVGLTGELNYMNMKQQGNLSKLIYDIGKPQEAEGAGGSWGLGKTVYFRMGIGLVIYYSRIKDNFGGYQSRMAASLVEDETKANSLIPARIGWMKRGIAWWGEKIGRNLTQPTINKEEISRILRIFDIKPYIQEETGTTIIIPYIDKEKLLRSNAIDYMAGDTVLNPSWRRSIEEYLKIAIQRWYAPRLNNRCYPYGKYLRARINGTGIRIDEMEPSYRIIQALYNRATGKKRENDILDLYKIEAVTIPINTKNVLKSSIAGNVSFVLADRKMLGMVPPTNKLPPYPYFNCEFYGNDTNKPIISYVRKPGMIVSYENVGPWTDRIPETRNDEYLIAVFVLDSSNKLAGEGLDISLEEYIRRGEMADHMSWLDHTVRNQNPKIVFRIQHSVANKISQAIKPIVDVEKPQNSKLGRYLGELLLPPDGFGRAGNSSGATKARKTKIITEHLGAQMTIMSNETTYSENGMTVRGNIKSKSKLSEMTIKMSISSERKTIALNEWEEGMGLEKPFDLQKAEITVNRRKADGGPYSFVVLKESPVIDKNGISVFLETTEAGSGHQIMIVNKNETGINADIKMTISVYRRDIRPVFSMAKK